MINYLSRLALCQQPKQSYPSPVCYILFLGTCVSHPGTNFQDIELPEIIFFFRGGEEAEFYPTDTTDPLRRREEK